MNVVIAGGSGGIGSAMVETLAGRAGVEHVIATWNRHAPAMRYPNVTWQQLDLADEDAVHAWAEQIGDIDWLINTAGMLHNSSQGPEKTIRQIDPAFFLENMSTNALPTLLLAKHLHASFRHGRPAVFATVSAKVGSIEDNRLGGWCSYRASKAALNMCLKTLSIEWQRTLPNVAIVALHPGTTYRPVETLPEERPAGPTVCAGQDRRLPAGCAGCAGRADAGAIRAIPGL